MGLEKTSLVRGGGVDGGGGGGNTKEDELERKTMLLGFFPGKHCRMTSRSDRKGGAVDATIKKPSHHVGWGQGGQRSRTPGHSNQEPSLNLETFRKILLKVFG